MVWYKAKWIPPLFAAVDIIAPQRDHGSDGTIGNTAHQGSSSGHNPDDTPGSKPEREDADSKPEVRAADVDSDLRQPGLTMQMIINAVLATPRDRNRLIYIIFNRSIWRAAGGWKREAYGGSDPHTDHAHFSGHPDADEDGAPWESILNLRKKEEEEDMGNQVLFKGIGPDPAQVWIGNGLIRRKVSAAELGTVTNGVPSGPISNTQVHQPALLGNLGNGGAIFQTGEPANAWGVEINSAIDVDALAHELAQELADDPSNTLTQEDIPAIASAVVTKFASALSS